MRMTVISQSGVYCLPAAPGRTHILVMAFCFCLVVDKPGMRWRLRTQQNNNNTNVICNSGKKQQQLVISSVRLFHHAAYYLSFYFHTFRATSFFFVLLSFENYCYTRVLLAFLLFDGR